jgi:hypothetical protein
MSPVGTFETCQPAVSMSGCRGRSEVTCTDEIDPTRTWLPIRTNLSQPYMPDTLSSRTLAQRLTPN